MRQYEPDNWLVAGTGVFALLAVVLDAVWRWTRNLVTIVHEGGHALTAVLTGRRLTGIRLHSDTSGLTLSVGRPSGPGMVVTAAAGYLAPSLVGLVGVVLLAFDQVTVMLWAAVALLLAMLIMVRNVYGALTLLVTGAIVVGVSLFTPADVQAGFGYAATWFLLLAGVRPVWELYRERRRTRRTDADQLAHLTHVPGGLWVSFFGLSTLAALAAGGWLLLT
ncbi:MAG TPA: M50 family metallopeptidase [Mycobacteriales bacterium]|nr:M50 family metallopeptidase [Mycobacteriales bacterium]